MKVLNLYACIGGNRKHWTGAEVTAVEYNPAIAAIYQELYPEDTVVVTDAHQYLLDHYQEFDFIWSSPPCPTHSRARFWSSKGGMYAPEYPDMMLWQEIIFLQHFCDKLKWVVENVIPYYDPLVKPTVELERHYFWSNFSIRPTSLDKVERDHNSIKPNDTLYGFNLSKYDTIDSKDKIQVLRNLVNPDLGLYIFEQAKGIIRSNSIAQATLFG